jgi:hypothetical protein
VEAAFSAVSPGEERTVCSREERLVEAAKAGVLPRFLGAIGEGFLADSSEFDSPPFDQFDAGMESR